MKGGVCTKQGSAQPFLQNPEGFFFFLHEEKKLPPEPAAAAPPATGQRRCYHLRFILDPSPARTRGLRLLLSFFFPHASSSALPRPELVSTTSPMVRHTAPFGVDATTTSRSSLATAVASPRRCSCSSLALFSVTL